MVNNNCNNYLETTETIRTLLRKHIAGSLTRTEKKELLHSIETTDLHPAWKQVMAELSNEASSIYLDVAEWEPMVQEIISHKQSIVPVVRRVHFLKTAWFRWAAVLLLIAGTTTFLYLRQEEPPKQIAVIQPAHQPDIQPGGNKAILTLSDGSTIVLDSAANGTLADQGGTRILKLNSGSLAYQAGAGHGEIAYNTISTPKGGQYQITLPDGTKVWLNAASSIRFPTAFGEDRTVEITGESYLEVAANKNKPFFVILRQAPDKETTIQVLGTSFNANAYVDEPAVKTTLVTGRIKAGSIELKPGQAIVNGVVRQANLQEDLSWKNGFFSFRSADIATIMRQIARWYNITVEYAGAIPTMQFTGEMDRGLPLSQVFETLAETGVKYKIENGNKLIIFP